MSADAASSHMRFDFTPIPMPSTNDNNTFVPEDRNRRPRYPPFNSIPSDQLLLTSAEASAYRASQIEREDAVADSTLYLMLSEPLVYVKEIYQGMIDMTEASDNNGFKLFLKLRECAVPTIDLVSASWKILVSFYLTDFKEL